VTGQSGREVVRYRVVYSGRVQGVYFRATARELSRRCAVVGYVRNLPDGRVELEAEGAADHVADFLAALERHYEGYITAAPRTVLPARGEETDFQIRY